ncbi:thiopurine S-methyltransferase [Magnetococcus sp. PR-3]|uniref:thiopurine S-methyltransferase n=1 Tax=Magnetococcus sp. PR-3 TaxID=3120355 RepID=UPI002FCE2A5F
MGCPDNALWLQAWKENHIDDFHQSRINPLLMRFWPGIKLLRGKRLFVPLCGKSLDMIWLAQQGYEVLGVELSPIAVAAFFKENGLRPTRRAFGAFTQWQVGRITVLCGDFFKLSSRRLGKVDWVYDRASLTALPPDLRLRYAKHLQHVTKAPICLMTTEEREQGVSEQNFMGVDPEISLLYGEACGVHISYVEPVKAHALATDAVHKVYELIRHPH